jgi:cobalt-zinc-cadmium efflux system outer membrane protein
MSRLGFILLASLLALPAPAQESPKTQEFAPQAGPTATDDQSPSSRVLTLEEVVSEALAKNPGVQSAVHSVEALRHRIPQAKSLPDPEVSVGWMGNLTPFSVQEGDPSSYRGIGVMQSIPYPGKLKLRGQIAAKDVDAAQWDYEAVGRRIVADVKAAYYDYFFYDKALQITRKDKDLLQKLSSISEARYRVGKGMQQDVLRSQVEITLLLQRITVLEQQRGTAQARLNTFMARDPGSPLPPAASVEPAALNEKLDALYALAAKNDTSLQREQQMVEKNRLATQLAHKDYLPDFGVAYMYQQRPMLPDMNGMTFTVNVPVFYKTKQREEVRQATEEVISAERSRDNRKNELQFELKEEYLAAEASKQLLDLFSKAVVPQSSLALESSMSAYEVGNVDFLTVLSNFSTILNYEVDYYRELANYQTALARMESLAGMELTSARPLPPNGGANSAK